MSDTINRPAWLEITGVVVMRGHTIEGVQFEFSRRSDGRHGYAAWLPGKWTCAGSETTLVRAMKFVEAVIKERTK